MPITLDQALTQAMNERNPEWVRYRTSLEQMMAPGSSAHNNPLKEYINVNVANAIRVDYLQRQGISWQPGQTVPDAYVQRVNEAVLAGQEQFKKEFIANAYLGYTRAQPIELSPMFRQVGSAAMGGIFSSQGILGSAWEALKSGLNTLIFDHIPAVRNTLGALNNMAGRTISHFIAKFTNETPPPLIGWSEAYRMAEAQHAAGLIGRGLRHYAGLNVAGLQEILVHDGAEQVAAAGPNIVRVAGERLPRAGETVYISVNSSIAAEGAEERYSGEVVTDTLATQTRNRILIGKVEDEGQGRRFRVTGMRVWENGASRAVELPAANQSLLAMTENGAIDLNTAEFRTVYQDLRRLAAVAPRVNSPPPAPDAERAPQPVPLTGHALGASLFGAAGNPYATFAQAGALAPQVETVRRDNDEHFVLRVRGQNGVSDLFVRARVENGQGDNAGPDRVLVIDQVGVQRADGQNEWRILPAQQRLRISAQEALVHGGQLRLNLPGFGNFFANSAQTIRGLLTSQALQPATSVPTIPAQVGLRRDGSVTYTHNSSVPGYPPGDLVPTPLPADVRGNPALIQQGDGPALT